MVHFINRRLGARQRLSVSAVRLRGGSRLVVRYPGGLRRVLAFENEAAARAGTAALQARLTADGWEPLHAPVQRRHAAARRPAAAW